MGRSAVLQGPNGRFDALAVGTDGYVYYAAAASYAAFEKAAWTKTSGFAVEVGFGGWDAAGTVFTAYCVNSAGQLFTAQCAPGSTGWGPWVHQPNAALMPPAASTPGPEGPPGPPGPPGEVAAGTSVTVSGTLTVA